MAHFVQMCWQKQNHVSMKHRNNKVQKEVLTAQSKLLSQNFDMQREATPPKS